MAPRTSVRNEQILTAIAELSRQVQARDEPLEAQMDEVTVKLGEVERGQAALERGQAALERAFAAAMAKEAKRDTCPFRDDIIAGANKDRRLAVLEDGYKEVWGSVHKVELKLAGWSVLAGGAMTAITALIEKLLEMARAGGGV